MRTERVAVLGSGCAGMIAALRIAGRVRRHARAVLIDPKDHFIEQLRLRQIGTGPKLAQPSYDADRFPELARLPSQRAEQVEEQPCLQLLA